MTDQTAACHSAQHCAVHGFCHRCMPSLADAAQHLVTAIDAAGIEYPASGRVYASLAATIRDAARQTAGQPAAEPVDVPTPEEGIEDARKAIQHVLQLFLDRVPRNELDAETMADSIADAMSDGLTELYRDLARAETALASAAQPDPTTVDDPVPLRWGLGDVLHSDDDTRIVCLSGPDREPYWLELDQERAAALRDDLAGPDGLAAPTNHDTETGVRNVIEHILTIYYQDSSAPSAFARALLAQHDASILNGAAQAYTDEADELERAAQEALDPGMARDAKYLRGFAASLRRLAAGAES